MMTKRFLFAGSIVFFCVGGLSAGPEADQEIILRGAAPVEFSGSVGTLLLYGESAFPIAEGTKGEVSYPVAAGARLGKGRLAAFAHESAFTSKFDANEKLLANLLTWLSGKTDASTVLKIGVAGRSQTLNELKSRQYVVAALDRSNWRQVLSESDVIVANLSAMSSEQAADLEEYVQQGGGLLCGFPGWAWSTYIARDKGAILKDECPANHLYQNAGIVWTTKTVSLTNQRAIPSNQESLLQTNVWMLLDAISDPQKAENVSPETVASALLQIGGALPSEDNQLIPRLKILLEKSQSQMVAPSTKKPLDPSQTQLYLGCLLDSVYAASAAPEELLASKLGEPALGSCPKSAKRQTISAKLDTTKPGRHGFGAYAAPGELIAVSLSKNAADAGFRIRVGAHSDKLWDKEKWSRPPQLDRVYPVNASSLTVANSYGGLIYLEVPKNCSLKSVEIQVENVLAAPYYRHGVTDPGDWRSSLRSLPGPWAELETDKVVLTLPSEMIRRLDFPDKLMDHWDEVLDACADLAGIPRDRPRHERILADVQPSLGWMHSGYPIVTNMRASAPMGNYQEMVSQGNWGYYHELGHNHQQKEWTFDGTVEVTCNLFGLYAFDTIHQGKAQHRFSDMTKWYEQAREHIAAGAPYETWKSKPFLALTMYEQMKREFGWKPFQTIFTDYQKMPANQKPKTDQDRRDQWMVRFSREVDRNLGPFFETWGVPTSDAARKSISELPVWMPDSLQVKVNR